MTILVDYDGGRDLIPVTIWDAENESIIEIARKINAEVLKCKTNTNKDHNEVKKLFDLMPTFMLGFLQGLISYLSQNAGISVKPLGVSFYNVMLNFRFVETNGDMLF